MELSTPQTQRKSVVFIEFLRILASFLVIVNHTNSDIFLARTPSPVWFASLTYFYVCRIAVPVFVIIAGYLMLDKQYSYRKTFQLILRILSCLVLFSGVYYIYYRYQGIVPGINPKFFLKWITREPITNAFWYLYMYLGLLVMLPFLQKLVSAMDRRDFHVFFLISGAFYGVLPIIQHYCPELTLSIHFDISLYKGYIFLMLVGCYLRRYCTISRKQSLIALGVFCLITAGNVLLSYWEYFRNDGSDYIFYGDNSLLPLLLASIAVFCATQGIRFGPKAAALVCSFGRLTFGIYLLADLFLYLLQPIYDALILRGYPIWVDVLVYELVVFFSGAICTWILKKLPVLRKIL